MRFFKNIFYVTVPILLIIFIIALWRAGDCRADATGITYTDHSDLKVVQRNSSDEGSLTIAGTYTGTIGTNEVVQARVVNDGTSTEVLTWTTVDAAPAANAFSGTLSAIPDGGWYDVDVRIWDTVLASSPYNDSDGTTNLGVGEVIALTGQSQATQWRTIGSAAGCDHCVIYDGSWASIGSEHGTTDDGVGIDHFTTTLNTELSVPIAIVYSATGGEALLKHHVYQNGWWLDQSGSSDYDNLKTYIGVVGDIRGVLWLQGEMDAMDNLDCTTQEYYDGLTEFYKNLRTDISADVNLYISILGKRTDGTNPEEHNAIQRAQLEFAKNNEFVWVAAQNQDHTLIDGVHYDEAGIIDNAGRMAETTLHTIDSTSYPYYRGPYCKFYTKESNTSIKVWLGTRGSTTLTTGAITGFEVLDSSGSALTIDSQTATNDGINPYVTLALNSSTPADDEITVRYLYGNNPTITTPIYDAYALADGATFFPLELNGNIPEREQLTGTSYKEGLKNFHLFDRKKEVGLGDELLVYDPDIHKFYKGNLAAMIRGAVYSSAGDSNSDNIQLQDKADDDFIEIDPNTGLTLYRSAGYISNDLITGTLALRTSNAAVHDTTPLSFTAAGVGTFSSFPVTPSAAPTTNYQVANKKYVDDNDTTNPVTAASAITANYITLGDDGTRGIKKSDTVYAGGTYADGSTLTIEAEQYAYLRAFSYNSNHATTSAAFDFQRSRGTKASQTTLSSGDRIGAFLFRGHDGTSMVYDASIEAFVDGAVSTGVVPSKISFKTTAITGSPTDTLVIRASGDVEVSRGGLSAKAKPVIKTATGTISTLEASGTFIRNYGQTATATHTLTALTGGENFCFEKNDISNTLNLATASEALWLDGVDTTTDSLTNTNTSTTGDEVCCKTGNDVSDNLILKCKTAWGTGWTATP